MSKIRYSADFRTAAVAQVLSRTGSIAQVAREVGCTVGTLHSWLKKYCQKTTPPSDKTSFVSVNVVDLQNPSAEIILPNGITIRLTDATPRSIAELVHALAPC
jgi:transposase-like protein